MRNDQEDTSVTIMICFKHHQKYPNCWFELLFGEGKYIDSKKFDPKSLVIKLSDSDRVGGGYSYSKFVFDHAPYNLIKMLLIANGLKLLCFAFCVLCVLCP